MQKRVTMMLFYIITSFSGVIFAQAPVITQEPLTQGVIEGDSTTFTIEATGDSLIYQWYKDGSMISGANDSVYVTPPTILGDNASEFFVIVTNGSGSDTSNTAKLFVTAIGSRVTASLVAAYDFKEGSGPTINDISGVGTPLNLTIPDLKSTSWTTEGLNITNQTNINSVVAASKVIDSCKASNELTVEAWIVPDNLTQGTPSLPSGIVTLTESNSFQNFSLDQVTTRFVGSVRTPQTPSYGSPTQTADGVVNTELTHLVFTRESNGKTKIYFDGIEIASDSIAGEFFDSWSSNHKLAIANSAVDGRPWLGTFYYTGIYNRSLNSNEVNHNFSLGIPYDTIPFISIQPTNKGAIVGQTVEFSAKAVGVSPLSYQWQKNGVDIPGANGVNYETGTLIEADNNSTFRVIVSNLYGSDTSATVVLAVTPANVRVTNGLALLYNFQEGSGAIINDLSGFGTPLNLQIYTPASVEWTDYGLNVTANASIVSNSAPTKLYNALTSTNEITIEAWIKPSLQTQSGEIVVLGQDVNNRNFMLMQEIDDTYVARLRTTTTNNKGNPHFPTSSGITQTSSITQIVYTRNTDGVQKIYINGSEETSGLKLGDFSNWEPTYLLAIANELVGDYHWVGLFNRLAIYNRALNDIEVDHNFNQLPEGGLPDIKTPGELTADPKLKKVELAWKDSSNNEDGFIIERKHSSFDFAVIDSVLANVTTFTDSNVVDTTNYTYRVKGYNPIFESDYSNEASVTTVLSTLAEPTNLAAVLNPADTHFVKITWNDNSSNETGFIVERKTGDTASVAPFVVVDTVGTNVVSYIDSAVVEFTTYTYRLKAFNLLIASNYSNMASVTTALFSVPAPTNLLAFLSPADTHHVKVTWTDNSPNELGFFIERKTGDTLSANPFTEVGLVFTNVTFFVDTTVADSTTYTYRVYAFKIGVVSNYSNLAQIATPVPVELTSFTANVLDGRVQLNWETATEINNAGFSIQRSKDNNKFIDLAFIKGNGTTTFQSSYSYLDKSILSGKYYYRLKQVDYDGSVNFTKLIEVDLGLPKDYALEQNYPNPFNPSTTIRFALPVNAKVTIKLYNALGQEVANILNTELEAGIHESIFNASNLSSGVYFYTLNVLGGNNSNFTSTKRMILMK